MSSVKTQSRYDASRHINYISTAAFNSAFFAYTFTGPSPANNFVGSGALSAVLNSSGVAVTASDCPAGRVLRTNGKRLYPDAAGIPVASLADRTPLIGVFDYHTNLSGFINPNATVFALYNVDKPVDNVDGTSAGSTNNTRGMSVFTGGTVTAVGDITTAGQLRSTTSTALTAISVATGAAPITRDINPALGQVFTLSVQATGGTNSIALTQATASPSGSIVYLVVTLTASHTTAISVAGTTNMKMVTQALGTVASKVWVFTFVSDGTNLNQVSISPAL
jgi:hypothetical protein